MIPFPKISLAVDNCFASKRWTTPDEWMREIASTGVRYAEASADTELDPLYHGADYVERWVYDARSASERYGVQIANLYSGHGTYATTGLCHDDRSVRTRLLERWIRPMVDTARKLDAGFGFFCHAFPESVMADPARYRREFDDLVSNLASVARYGRSIGLVRPIGVEQMYSPHQVPWKIDQTMDLLRRAFARDSAPLYVTIDVGHQSGQHRFRAPTHGEIRTAIAAVRGQHAPPDVWIGADDPTVRLTSIAQLPASRWDEKIATLCDGFAETPYLFSEPRDSNPYSWLRELAGWSPIVHLQQTDGNRSAHWAFDDEKNRSGIIDGRSVLNAIYDHYASAKNCPDVPPRVDEIFLTIEIFSGTADSPSRIRRKIRDSVAYWRRFVPRDGETVDSLIDRFRG